MRRSSHFDSLCFGPQLRRPILTDHIQDHRQPLHREIRVQPLAKRAVRRPARRRLSRYILVNTLLRFEDVPVKPEHLVRRRLTIAQFAGGPNSLVPTSSVHDHAMRDGHHSSRRRFTGLASKNTPYLNGGTYAM